MMAAGNLIGLNCPHASLRDIVARSLPSAGWDVTSMRGGTLQHRGDRCVFVESDYMAETIRSHGGQVIHLETGSKPFYPDHRSPSGIHVHVGDSVLCGFRGHASALVALLVQLSKTEDA